MPQVVKTEALPLRKNDASADCRWPQMILNENRRPERHFAVLEQRRKDEIIDFEYGLSRATPSDIRQHRMHRHIAVRGLRLVSPSCPLAHRFDMRIGPSLQRMSDQRNETIWMREGRGGASQDQCVMQRGVSLLRMARV